MHFTETFQVSIVVLHSDICALLTYLQLKGLICNLLPEVEHFMLEYILNVPAPSRFIILCLLDYLADC